ncbi:MAG TPA: amino acid ABC transporter ATP-binding protein [Acidimicrobiales bacterium]|nr:amino acid ABC transporter ATP-binding protein [Acidimicrobiales bacterium]
MRQKMSASLLDQARDKSRVAVELRSVSRHFGDVAALERVDLEVLESQVIALIGPSGSGKSTLLRCINNLERVDEGSIHVFGERVGISEDSDRPRPLRDRAAAAQRIEIGMVFQNFNLFGHMTALENVMSGLVHVRHTGKDAARARAVELLERVGLGSKQRSYTLQLSGGQQQRVAIARALAMSPRLMLFDEPTSALDPETIVEVLDVIRTIADGGMTLLIATHEMGFARGVSDEVVFMDAGRIVERGLPQELFLRPKTERCQEFLSRVLHSGREL